MKFFQRIAVLVSVALVALTLAAPRDARAFCGFYVGKADGALVNHASQVVIAHHDDKTVISLMNDYQGEPSEFALVVPVPVVLQKGQVHIGDRELFQKIDAYSSPRLVEYFERADMLHLLGVQEFCVIHRLGAEHVRLVEAIDGVHWLAEGEPRAFALVVAPARLVLMPLGLRELREKAANLRRKRG